jgi:hypothetical protein
LHQYATIAIGTKYFAAEMEFHHFGNVDGFIHQSNLVQK